MNAIVRRTAYVVILWTIIVGSLQACSSTPARESTGEYIDDAAITAKVKAVLINDSLTQSAGIDAKTYKGLVQLSGFASEDEQRVRAAQLALKVPGVKTVRNDILLENQQAER